MSSIAVFLCIILTVTEATPETCTQGDSCRASSKSMQADGVSLLQFQQQLGQAPAAKADANKTAPAADAKDAAAEGAAANAAPADAATATAAPPSDAAAVPATTENATGNKTSNETGNVTENTTTEAPPTGCATKKDPRASSWFAETSPDNTPCVFGADPRDEGTHCIHQNGQYGSNGWCFTNIDLTSWGSCNGKCPLYGGAAQLGSKIDGVAKAVHDIHGMLNSSDVPTTAPSADAEVTTPPPAADAKPAAAEEKPADAGKNDAAANKESALSQTKTKVAARHSKVKQDPAPAADAAAPAADAAGNETAAAPAAAAGANETAAPAAGGNETSPAAEAAPVANATENASNVTNATVEEAPTSCATKEDARVAAWFAETAAPGTPCVFGVDVRDEGSHCIHSDGKYGSNGWCFTNQEQTQWGSCNELCPLYGEHAKLGNKIDTVADIVGSVNKHLETQLNGTTPEKPGEPEATGAAEAASATTAAPATPATDAKPAVDAKPAADAKKEA